VIAPQQFDERGSMLVIALIMIMIVGFAGVAVLTQQNSASKVQIVYTSAQQRELAFDGAIDSAVRDLRFNTHAGIPPSSGGTACSDATLPGSTFGTLTWNGDVYELYCAPAPTSGQAIAPTNGDRIVAISLCDPGTACAVGHVRLRTQVRLVDQPSLGTAVKTLSWVRDPTCEYPAVVTCPPSGG
jgi:type II secretory pathway pseudopilin PulG